ncbi:MAG: flagellar assembly protein FliW [Oscillospiraceae bacterium]|nr:flagellar assembly protein FliW [Oscillospiraceae bacterium]MCI9289140.1 flagellar assembly protein FliW [Oscillospiraceae bacterium]MCI9550307.1 flagellar assembly protein FliW [Oscillospiraceae bacterium]
MKLHTKYFGEIEYLEEDLLHFTAGPFGFEEEREFLLLPFEGSAGTLLCFQSTRTPALAFVAMDPFALLPEYAPVLQPQELEELGVSDSQELGFYVLCVVKKPVSDSTVNLKCPVAINPDTRAARQVILESDVYEMRHSLAQFSTEEGAPC